MAVYRNGSSLYGKKEKERSRERWVGGMRDKQQADVLARSMVYKNRHVPWNMQIGISFRRVIGDGPNAWKPISCIVHGYPCKLNETGSFVPYTFPIPRRRPNT